MRILHVSDVYLPRTGGIELHVKDLAAAQRARGDIVDILTLSRDDSSPAAESVRIIRPDGPGPVAAARLVRHASAVIAAGDYDVVHAHCSTVSPLAFSVLRKPAVPTVVTVHSLWRRYTAIYRGFDRCLGWSRWPVSVTAVSSVAARCVSASAGSPLEVTVLPNGIDVAQWRHPGHDRRQGDPVRVAAVMRLALRKRPFALLKVLRATRRELPPCITLHATIVGGGRWRGAMERYITAFGLADTVHLAGELPREEIAQLLARTDVFIAPSTLESFGIAAAEAHAAGVPVLGRTHTGLEHFVLDDSDGVLVSSDAEMVRCLVAIARNDGLVPGSAPNRAGATVNTFDWSSVVAVTRDHYERTIAAAHGVQERPAPSFAPDAASQLGHAGIATAHSGRGRA